MLSLLDTTLLIEEVRVHIYICVHNDPGPERTKAILKSLAQFLLMLEHKGDKHVV